MRLAPSRARDALSVVGRDVLVGVQAHALREALQPRHVSLSQLEHEITRQRLVGHSPDPAGASRAPGGPDRSRRSLLDTLGASRTRLIVLW